MSCECVRIHGMPLCTGGGCPNAAPAKGHLHAIADDLGVTGDGDDWIDVAREGLEAAWARLLGAHAAFAEYLERRGG